MKKSYSQSTLTPLTGTLLDAILYQEAEVRNQSKKKLNERRVKMAEEKKGLSSLTPNELPEWAEWNKNNWMIILKEYDLQDKKWESMYDLSEWLWKEYPQRVEFLAKTNPRNYDDHMSDGWLNKVNEMRFTTDYPYGLESVTIEEDGEFRDATDEEIEYFEDKFGADIEDAASEHWYEKCI